MVDEEERRGSMTFKKPQVIDDALKQRVVPVRTEIATKKIPVRVQDDVERVGEKLAQALADSLYRMLLAAQKSGIKDLELLKMANV